jgi:translocation and assembly module TamB
MRRALKISACVAGGLVALILLLLGALLIIGNTDSGRALIVRLTAQLTKGHVHLSGINGSFPAALDLDRLELSDDRGVWLFADHISLRWSPMELLTRHIQVDTLHVARLHIERPPLPDKEKKPSTTPSIPRSDLAHLSIDTLELGPELAGTAVSLVVHGTAHLNSLQDATANIVAQRTGGIGDYELQVQFDPARMAGTLKVQEPANGPLENILKIPGLGDLSVLAKLSGPRAAESIQLTLDAGALHGKANGTIDLNEISADLQYSLTASEMTPFAGLTWKSIDLQGRWHGTVKTPSANARLRAKELQVPGGTRIAALAADLNAEAGLLRLQSTVEGLQIPGPSPTLFQNAPLNLNATVHLNDEQRPVEITATHPLFALKANAITAGQQSAQIDLRLPDIAPFAALGGQTARGDATIKAQVSRHSTSTHLAADISATLDGGKAAWAGLLRGGNTRLQLAGDLTDEKVAIDRLQLTGPSLSMSANGSVSRAASADLDIRLDLSLPNLAKVSPALAGTLKLSGKVNGPGNSLSAAADLTSTLSIHGSPSGTISATVLANGLPKTPRGTVEAHGDLDGAPLVLNVSVEQEANTVHAIIRHADWKSAHIEGDIRGGADLAQARGNVALRMNQLGDLNRLLGSTLQGSVTGNLALAPVSGHSHAQLQIDAHDVVTGSITTNAQLSAEGGLDALNIKLAAQSPAVGGEPASVTSTAQLNTSAQELHLADLQATYHGQTVKLLSPARLSFADGLSVDDLKLGAQEARVEVSGRLSPTLDARASLRQLKPDLINAFVPHLLASGTIQADVQVQGSFAAPTGKVRLDATGLRAANDAALGLPATDIHAGAQLLAKTADIDAKLTAGSGSQLALKGSAPLAADGALNLKLTGNLDMGLLNPLLEARGRHVTGALTIDTTVTGATASPEIGGKIRLAKGTLRDYTQGTNLSDINGELTGEHGTLKIESLTARAAPGTVSVEGTIGILQPQIPVDLKLTAKNAQPIANNIITANLDANMKIHGTARARLDVAGTIHINRADVEIPSGLPPNVAVLDVRRPGQKAPPKPEQPLVIGLDVTLDAPRQILVKGRGLDSELGGEIRVRGTTEDPIVSGGFELQRGTFTLASSKLTFSSGSNGTVTFNGAGLKNKIDPTLDFTAQTVVGDVTAIVRITGLADSPKIELSSTPDLPQDEILARLLFGVPASQLTTTEVVQIGAALATLGSGGGGGFNPVAKIQKALGLDRLTVGSAASTGSTAGNSQQQNNGYSIEAGRYVSSRVFVAVKETTTGASQLAVDVDLTKHLKLQTRLGNGTATEQGTTPENDPGSSVGIAYQFEY